MKKLSSRAYFLKKTVDFFFIGMFLILLLFLWTVYKGPVAVPFLKPYIVQALNYDQNDYAIDIGNVNIEFVRSIQPLRVTADNINLKKNDGTIDIKAPKLYLSFSLRALLKGIIAPSDISVLNPTVYIYASYGVEEENKHSGNQKKIQFYIEKINEFLENYNSAEKLYPESYVNSIIVKNGELEFHEVDFGRKWMFSDVNLEFNRNILNMEINANTLVNINDKIASIGFESKYQTSTNKLNMEIYFSDLILSDFMSTLNDTTEDNLLSVMAIEVPVNGKIYTTLNMNDILNNPEFAGDYIDTAIEKLNFEIDGGHGYVSFDGNEKYNYDIEEMLLTGEVKGGIDEIHIDNAEFKMGGQKAIIDIHISGLETYYLEQDIKDLYIRFKAKVKEFPLDELSHFWPRYIAEPAWQWCKDSLLAGQAKNAEFIFDFGYNRRDESLGLLKLNGKATLEDGDIYYLEGMPLVENVYGTAYFSEKNISINIDKGVSDEVIITGGNVNIYDLDKYDNFISIKLVGNSPVSEVLTLIDNPPLKITSDIGIPTEGISGDVDIKLNLDFELRQDLDSKDIKVAVDADLHNIISEHILSGHILEAEQLKLKVDSYGWQLDGDAKYDKIPLKLNLTEKFADKKYDTKCNIRFVLDDEAKKNLGIDWKILDKPNLSGYATVNADLLFAENGDIEMNLTADLQSTKINYNYLGFIKHRGEEASLRAKVLLVDNKLKSISDITLLKPDFTINGNVQMYNSGRVKTVDITQISGPKTSASAKISLTDTDNPFIKVDVSGNSFDLIPLFASDEQESSNTSQPPKQENEDDGLEQFNNTDIFITTNSLWTNDTTPIKNFAGSAKIRKGIGLHEVHIVGNYGVDKSIKLNLDYIPRSDNEHYLSIDSNNAGSTLKVLRLYDNMVGGILKIEARRLADKKFIGHAMVRDFSIQNAPVITKLLSVASFSGMIDLIKGDGLTFTHFSAPLEYQHKILHLKHAKAEGNVVGITTTGTYNRALDDFHLYGVIAPAYSLNRFLGKIPVVGNLLASKDGTIFAADYKINGSVKNPEIDINSLSILSPNSMKEWYNKNFGDGDDI